MRDVCSFPLCRLKSCWPAVALKLLVLSPSKQCAAVRTQRAWMSVPPQNCPPRSDSSICHGKAPARASCPFTIEMSGPELLELSADTATDLPSLTIRNACASPESSKTAGIMQRGIACMLVVHTSAQAGLDMTRCSLRQSGLSQNCYGPFCIIFA